MEDMQTKLNERVRNYLDTIEGAAFAAKFLLCCLLMGAGVAALERTNGSFGDVPFLVGAYYMKKLTFG